MFLSFSGRKKKRKMLKVKIVNPRESAKKAMGDLTQGKKDTPAKKKEIKNKIKRSSSKNQKYVAPGNQNIAHKNSGKCIRQKELAAERQRRRRARMTAEELDIKRQKDRERYYKKREKKIILPISQRSLHDQRLQREEWRKNSKNYRTRKFLSANLTPQVSDNEDGSQFNSTSNLFQTPQSCCSTIINGAQESKQKKNARKQGNITNAKAYRIIEKQNNIIKQLKRQLEKYKKRYYRQKNQPVTRLTPSLENR